MSCAQQEVLRCSGDFRFALGVEITDDRTVSVARIFRGSFLNMFGERFPTDLVLIPLRGLKVIIGMDWLGPNGSMIH